MASRDSIDAGLSTLQREQEKRGLSIDEYASEQGAAFTECEKHNVQPTTYRRIHETKTLPRDKRTPAVR